MGNGSPLEHELGWTEVGPCRIGVEKAGLAWYRRFSPPVFSVRLVFGELCTVPLFGSNYVFVGVFSTRPGWHHFATTELILHRMALNDLAFGQNLGEIAVVYLERTFQLDWQLDFIAFD